MCRVPHTQVGLRRDSPSWQLAESVGFTEKGGSLGEMFETIRESDLVILLISDAAQVRASHRRNRQGCGIRQSYGMGARPGSARRLMTSSVTLLLGRHVSSGQAVQGDLQGPQARRHPRPVARLPARLPPVDRRGLPGE